VIASLTSDSMEKSMPDIAAFVSAVDNVPVATDPTSIRFKSRDYYSLSPMLQKTLKGKQAELVVSPRDRADVVRVAAASYQHDVPLTPRGNGTANYGQSVPLRGGAMLDMTALSGIVWIKPGAIRALAGTTMEEIDAAARATGQELRFFPSTRKRATIAGFVAGGTGGVGSITWGVLRDRGNILGVEAVSLESAPRIVQLRGGDAGLVQHAYGTNGIITEVEMPLVPAWDWFEAIIAFPDYAAAIGCAIAVGRACGIVKKLASAYEWPIGQWIKPFRSLVPEGASIAILMIAEASREAFLELLGEFGGTVVSDAPEGHGSYGLPLYEFAFGHTMLHVQRAQPRMTEIEGFFRDPDLPGLVERARANLQGAGPMRLEVRRWEGDIVCSGSPFIDFVDEAQVADVVRRLQEVGVKVANPHASNVRGVGKKEIGPREIRFKREMDPKGLLNPGRFEVHSGNDTTIDKHLPTDGWLSAQAGARKVAV
jgi:FAD/FMN-containing dehydrogenase